uniref:Uncharacterized protein n=1 Tax=Callorhinchus milii TaxID=7868 RepID=A0A4W3JYW3_CALMI
PGNRTRTDRLLEWNAHSILRGTHPAYLIPESIRRRMARAKAWGDPRVSRNALWKEKGVSPCVLTTDQLVIHVTAIL